MAGQTFEATIVKDEDSGGAGVVVPAGVAAAFGKKGRVPVRFTIDGQPYRGSIFPYGGVYYLGVVRKVRDAIGKTFGDNVHVVIELDEEPRAVAVPEDFARALAGNATAGTAFDKLSYSHKREYVEWIAAAKKDETRRRRIAKAIEKLNG